MANGCSCGCSQAPRLIFPCSGAADVGELADRVGRKMTSDGRGSMYCLAGIGGKVSGIIESTKAAGSILAIDGCSLNCAKKTLTEAGFTQFQHLTITDLEFKKGETKVNETSIAKVAQEATKLLAGEVC